MTIQEAAQTALDVQNAVNLSGVLATFSDIVQNVIWPEARKQSKGTEYVNTHPIVTLFLVKMCDLNRYSDALTDGRYTDALLKVSALSRAETLSWKEVQS